jgi:hypothetical protein
MNGNLFVGKYTSERVTSFFEDTTDARRLEIADRTGRKAARVCARGFHESQSDCGSGDGPPLGIRDEMRSRTLRR